MSERKERCETCRFWQALHPKDMYPDDLMWTENEDGTGRVEIGWCRRFPPVVLESMFRTSATNAAHVNQVRESPIVYDDDWCGEWQPKETASGLPEPPPV